MNKKLISKCCQSSYRQEDGMFGKSYNVCDKCGAFCDVLPQPINTQAECLMAKVYPHHEPIQKEDIYFSNKKYKSYGRIKENGDLESIMVEDN